MKSWRIHLAWAIVTVLAVALTARLVTPRPEGGVRPGAKPAPTAGPLPPSPPLLVSLPPPPSVAEAPAAGALAPSATPSPESLSPEQIRAMLREKVTWPKAFEALKLLPDRALKLKILEECFKLSDVDRRIPHSALAQLREMGGDDVAELVERIFRDSPEDPLRISALRTLARLEQPRSLGALLEGYRLDNLDAKVWSAMALLKLGHPGPSSEMLSTLTRSLDNADGGLRRETLEYISMLETPAAIPILTRCLSDSNGDVRSEAISGLETLALPEVFPLLERASQDPNPNVADDARRALERLKKAREKADKP